MWDWIVEEDQKRIYYIAVFVMKNQARQCPVQEKIGMHITLTTNTVLFTLHVARKMAFRLLMCAFFYYLEVTSHSSGLTLWEGKGSIWDSLHTTGHDRLC